MPLPRNCAYRTTNRGEKLLEDLASPLRLERGMSLVQRRNLGPNQQEAYLVVAVAVVVVVVVVVVLEPIQIQPRGRVLLAHLVNPAEVNPVEVNPVEFNRHSHRQDCLAAILSVNHKHSLLLDLAPLGLNRKPNQPLQWAVYSAGRLERKNQRFPQAVLVAEELDLLHNRNKPQVVFMGRSHKTNHKAVAGLI
jgi:hypothetical protein